MAEISANQTVATAHDYSNSVGAFWITDSSWLRGSGSDGEGWWTGKVVTNAPTYREGKTRELPHASQMRADISAEFLSIDTSTNRESVTGDIVISRSDFNYFTRITPAMKEAHRDIGVLYKLVAAEGFLVVALAALLMAMRHARKLDLAAMLTTKTNNAKKK